MKLKTLKAKHQPYPIVISDWVDDPDDLLFITEQFKQQGVDYVFRKKGNYYSIWRELLPSDVSVKDPDAQHDWFGIIRRMSRESERYEIIECNSKS